MVSSRGFWLSIQALAAILALIQIVFLAWSVMFSYTASLALLGPTTLADIRSHEPTPARERHYVSFLQDATLGQLYPRLSLSR